PVHDGSLLVMRALERAAPKAPAEPPPPPRRVPSRRLRTFVLVAAVLTLAGAAGAARMTGVWSILAPKEQTKAVGWSPTPAPSTKVAAPAPEKKPAPERGLTAMDPAPAPEPVVTVPEHPPAKPTLAATARATDAPRAAPPPPPAPVDDATGAGPMFARANAA